MSTSQLSFLDLPPVQERGKSRRTDPPTSIAAGESVNVSALEARVWAYLCFVAPQGRTSRELAEEMELSRITISPRLKPLETKGKVRRSGETRDGCQVWVGIK